MKIWCIIYYLGAAAFAALLETNMQTPAKACTLKTWGGNGALCQSLRATVTLGEQSTFASRHPKAALQYWKRPLVYLRKSLRLDSSWPGRWTMMGSLCACPWRRCGALASRTALWARSEPKFAYRDTSASSSSCSSLEKNTNTQEMFFVFSRICGEIMQNSLQSSHYEATQKIERSKSLIPALEDSSLRWMWWPTWRGGEAGSVLRRSISPRPHHYLRPPRWLIWVTQSASGHFKPHFIWWSRTPMWSALTDQPIVWHLTPMN